jgi:hypothetical protein
MILVLSFLLSSVSAAHFFMVIYLLICCTKSQVQVVSTSFTSTALSTWSSVFWHYVVWLGEYQHSARSYCIYPSVHPSWRWSIIFPLLIPPPQSTRCHSTGDWTLPSLILLLPFFLAKVPYFISTRFYNSEEEWDKIWAFFDTLKWPVRYLKVRIE